MSPKDILYKVIYSNIIENKQTNLIIIY